MTLVYPTSTVAFARVECRRYKTASEDMRHKADLLTSVQTSLEAAMAAQSYHQGQIMQLSYAVACLQEQLNTFTAQQSHEEAAENRGNFHV